MQDGQGWYTSRAMSGQEDQLDRLFGEESEREHGVDEEFEMFESSEKNSDINEKDGEEESQLITAGTERKRTLADVRTKEMTLKKMKAPRDSNRIPMLLKLPGFMGLDRSPYSVGQLLEGELSGYERAEKESHDPSVLLRAANSIRWRFDQENTEKVETNARLVRWSDGTFSLMVGEEFFEVSVQNMIAEQNYIYGRHVNDKEEQEPMPVMECLGRLKERIMIRPYITDDQRHRKFLAAAATASAKASSDVRVKMAVTTADPEKEKQRMVKLEQEKIKARRKLEAQRRNLKQRSFERVARTGLTARFLEERPEEDFEEGADEDEYEQDFIDDTNVDGSGEEESEVEQSTSESEAEFSGKEEEAESHSDEPTTTYAPTTYASNTATATATAATTNRRGRRAAIVDDDDE